jgi:peptidoglycan/xylan/chitin deacetylase (PgdA/CDA1 family)
MSAVKAAILTVELVDHDRAADGSGGAAIARRIARTLEVLADIDARATFLCEGRLAGELPTETWRSIAVAHEIGCHGHAWVPVERLGAAGFRDDVRAAKRALEDVTGVAVASYRAPEWSGSQCDPWFGEVLAAEGFALDASRRLDAPPPEFAGTLPLPGSAGAVLELPVLAVGVGTQRMTVIGGAPFRLLPLASIRLLLERAESLGFVPQVVLHPHDLDATEPLDPPRGLLRRAAALVQRTGRDTVAGKLKALTYRYRFDTLAARAGAAVGPRRP